MSKRVSCETTVMTKRFICKFILGQIKLVFNVLHEDSFSNRGKGQFGDGLLDKNEMHDITLFYMVLHLVHFVVI